MATQIVELTGDEAKLLRSLEKVIKKQTEYERKLYETGQQGDAAGIALSGALSKVEQESQNALKGLLKDLNQVGPEGREVSAQLKKHLVDAGKIGEKSISDMIDELERLDPESAAAARKIAENVEESTERGKASFSDFGRSAVFEITSIATGFLSVGGAISAVNAHLQEQRDLLLATRDIQLELGKAQQEAAKNLAGLTVVERDELLREAVPEIAGATGFSDVSEITQALGAVASAGESNAEKIKEAVEQAARIELLTPDQLDSTAAASSALQRQANLADIRQAIALVETTGTQARITDPTKLVESLPRAVGSLVSTVPQQDPETAAREAAALFAQITQGGNDEKGTSSATFAIDFGTRLSKFFTELPDEQVKARSKIELIDRKIGKGTDTELDRQNKERLNEFLQASKDIADPQTLFGRLNVLQSDPALQRQFVGEGFGEKQFQTALTALLDESSPLVTALNQSFAVIQANSEFFEREAAALAGGTPQLALARFQQSLEASLSGQKVADTEGASLAQVRENARKVFKSTLPRGIEGFVESRLDYSEMGGLKGSTAAEESVSLVRGLLNRAALLKSDGIQTGDEAKLKTITEQIVNTFTFLDSQGRLGALDLGGVNRARRVAGSLADENAAVGAAPIYAETFNRLEELLTRIAESNESMEVQAPPVEPAPAAAPALSADVP